MMIASLPYQDFVPYSQQKSVSKWLGTFSSSKFIYKPIKSFLPFVAKSIKKFVFDKFLTSELIKANLTLKGLLERIDTINEEEANSVFPVLKRSLKMANEIEIKAESFKNYAPVLLKEAEEMASILEDLYTEVDFILHPESYEDSINITTNAFQQFKAVEEGLVKPVSLDSILN